MNTNNYVGVVLGPPALGLDGVCSGYYLLTYSPFLINKAIIPTKCSNYSQKLPIFLTHQTLAVAVIFIIHTTKASKAMPNN